ncbi:zinc-binding dehydrogenase [Agromyces sp. NPDC049794]|uniref:zinc-binding dehydrogenase n=1 Tax=unclassified Agromyces TaxID=2639701 RepID=UPI00340B3811
MRAVLADRPGPPGVLRLTTLPDPEPGARQVRVAVEASAITFVDTMVRAGNGFGPPVTFPAVLGNGVGGVVDAVGDGVDPGWLGALVVTATGGAGGYASAALADVADLHRIPDGLDVRAATALLADGRTAVGLHEAAAVRPGDVVVVSAAAGGVGSLLVQLATASGARVIALAGSDTKLERARALGAAVTLNYREPDWLDRLDAAAPDGLDIVYDGVGADLTAALAARVRGGGRYLQHGASGGRWGELDAPALTERGVAVISLSEIGSTPEELFRLVERALELGARGELRPVIGQTFPLEQAAEAHAAIEARTTVGKTLLLP